MGIPHKFFGGIKMAWTSAHTILGELENGIKVVMTNVVPDSDVTTAVVIKPLRSIISYFPGVKDPGDAPVTFAFSATASTLNSIDINPSGDATGGLIGILTFGV